MSRSVAAARDVGNPVDLRILHDADHGSWGRVRGVQWAMAKSASVAQLGAFLQGLFTNLSNPKALVFFGAIFSPFLTSRIVSLQTGIVVGTLIVLTVVWFGLVALAASQRRLAPVIDRFRSGFDVIASCFFIAVGLGFLITALVHLLG